MTSVGAPTAPAAPAALGGKAFRALLRTHRPRVLTEGADWLLDATVVVFALWTVCCHMTVASGGTGTRLFNTAAIAGAVAFLMACVFGYRMRVAPPRIAASESARAPLADESISLVGLGGSVTLIAYWLHNRDVWLFWLGSMAFLIASSAFVLAKTLPTNLDIHAGQPNKRQSAVLWLLALVGAFATAFMNRPNSDDVLYINFAVALADHPEYVLYSRDTLHGEGMTQLNAYSVHSFELLAGALSRLTGVSSIRIIHMWFAPFAGLLTAFAWARLFRLIEPRRWLWLVAIVVSCYLLDGSTEASITGHAYMRLFQGKAVLLTVVVPLISANAIAFVLKPSWTKWVILTASVVSGIGMSSTGMWLAMLVGATSLFVPMTFRWSFFRTAAVGMTSLVYPLVLALWMRALIHTSDSPVTESAPASLETASASASALPGILRSFGTAPLAHGYIACLLLGWPLARTALARRYLLAFTLGGFAVLVNPIIRDWVADNLTGHSTYPRVLWYLPFSAAFALCFAGALPTSGKVLGRTVGAVVTFLALMQFYTTLPTRTALANLEYPARLKVNPEGYKISKYLVKRLGDDCSVLAPAAISLVLPMLQHHPYAVMTKPKFFADGGGERFRLRRMVDLASAAKIGRRRDVLIGALERYNIRGVVMTEIAARTEGLVETLEIASFRESPRFPSYRVWLRQAWPVVRKE